MPHWMKRTTMITAVEVLAPDSLPPLALHANRLRLTALRVQESELRGPSDREAHLRLELVQVQREIQALERRIKRLCSD